MNHSTAAIILALVLASRLGDATGRPLMRVTQLTPALDVLPAPHVARRLLQIPDTSDCNRTVLHCEACSVRVVHGSSKFMCTACEAGYTVKARGRACWCAAGYYLESTSQLCVPCGFGFYCPGAKSTQASGEARISCGLNKNTTSQMAQVNEGCVTNPGYGWAPGDAVLCPVGFYATGRNNRRCSSCPGGLTTASEGATSHTLCLAPAGFYYDMGRAVACAKGSFKDQLGNEDCTSCPEGFTTENGTAATAAAECKYVDEGYGAPGGLMVGNSTALPCPKGFYRTGHALYDANGGVPCTPCPANMNTLSEGASSKDACLAPPGYGWNVATGDASICQVGWYNEGWNKEACIKCGGGTVTTDGQGSIDENDCKVPAGHGTTRSLSGTWLVAEPCPVATFGRDMDTYGLGDVVCSTCPDNSTTVGVGSTISNQCVTMPGFGWEKGDIQLCNYAYYSPGGTHDPCTLCGEGYNTSTTGANSPSDCQAAAGWTVDAATGSLKPCAQGYYKTLLGTSQCQKCPAGTTTTSIPTAVAVSDCNACQPGFGSVSIDPASPSCTACPSGTFSAGRVRGGQQCQACPKPDGYTGDMVSRKGSSTPESCVAAFTSEGPRNLQDWDFIEMDPAAMTVAADDTVEACQATCRALKGCQCFTFDDNNAAGQKCYLRDKVPYAPVDPADASRSYVFFEVAAQLFVGYLAHSTDAAALGRLLNSYPSRAEAEAACNHQAECIGFKFIHTEPTDPWRTFAGTLKEGVTGKVRARGENLNPWIAQPN